MHFVPETRINCCTVEKGRPDYGGHVQPSSPRCPRVSFKQESTFSTLMSRRQTILHTDTTKTKGASTISRFLIKESQAVMRKFGKELFMFEERGLDIRNAKERLPIASSREASYGLPTTHNNTLTALREV
ncbi:hypothetical protein POM88_010108 [Heracleum sosnowskyi]|uniref:Uncharacterized protein n=1 Tax=Heracleum sosnowskyi TaxID=360622 RepID=A0AAD8N3D2_9APIA|nr:hypothetical protein POM88_010108 [Heracleum sosnowskyi]